MIKKKGLYFKNRNSKFDFHQPSVYGLVFSPLQEANLCFHRAPAGKKIKQQIHARVAVAKGQVRM